MKNIIIKEYEMRNKKIIFFAVDCQKDFINPNGALYVKDAETIKSNLKKLTDFAKENNIMVVNTRDWHSKNDEELSDNPDFINTFPEHCIYSTKGAEFIEETKPLITDSSELGYMESTPDINLGSRNIIIDKNKFDVFQGNPHTDKFFELINPDIAIVYGVATNICVDYAVLGLTKRNIEVIVVKDAIKELPNLPVTEIYEKWNENKVGWIDTNTLVNDLQPLFDTEVVK